MLFYSFITSGIILGLKYIYLGVIYLRLKSWIKLGLVGLAVIGLTACSSKKTVLKKPELSIQKSGKWEVDKGRYQLAYRVYGKATPGAIVRVRDNKDEVDKIKVNKSGEFTVPLYYERTSYSFTASNGTAKSKRCSLVTPKQPSGFDPKIKWTTIAAESDGSTGWAEIAAKDAATLEGQTTPNTTFKITDRSDKSNVYKAVSDANGKLSIQIPRSDLDQETTSYEVDSTDKDKLKSSDYAEVFFIDAGSENEDTTASIDTPEGVTYSDLMNATTGDYSGTVSFKGVITQITSDPDGVDQELILIAVNGDTSDIVVAQPSSDYTMINEISEGDNISFVGTFLGQISFNVGTGEEVPVPALKATYISLTK